MTYNLIVRLHLIVKFSADFLRFPFNILKLKIVRHFLQIFQILVVKTTDAAKYTCQAENMAGLTEKYYRVEVQGQLI